MLGLTDKLRVINFLKYFGCSSQEVVAYLEALKMETISVQELARRLKRNRITVHYTVQQLIKKGFLFETRKGKRHMIAAENPEVLSRMIDQRYNELKSLESCVGHVTQVLANLQSSKHVITLVRVYEESEGIKKMLEEMLDSKGEILTFTNIALSKILGEEYVENYFARRAAHNIHTRIIYPPDEFVGKLQEKSTKYKIDVRTFPQDIRSESGFYVWNNKVALHSLKEEKRSCTIIENHDIANFFRNNIFNHFWEEAQTL